MVARFPKPAMIGPTDVSGRLSIGFPRFSSSGRPELSAQKQRIGDKIFRNFPKCGKIRLLEKSTEGEASFRRMPAAARGDCAMEAHASSEVFLFEDFRLDRRDGGLFQRDDDGAFTAVAIGSRGLDILGVLIEMAGEVVSKNEIIAAVWPGTVVEESNLTVQISGASSDAESAAREPAHRRVLIRAAPVATPAGQPRRSVGQWRH
jgi:hypothetical protein